jgi:hypothetical protein
MNAQVNVNPWWAALSVWGMVNAVNVLQATGLLSRVVTGSRVSSHLLGYGVVALGAPALLCR